MKNYEIELNKQNKKQEDNATLRRARDNEKD